MSYASITHGRRAQRKNRRRSILLDSIQNMDTIIEENINEVNWNSFVDPRTEQRFDRKVVQRHGQSWKDEQDIFDDELLKLMFHWDPDYYSKLPNKSRRYRNRNSSNNANNAYNNANIASNYNNANNYNDANIYANFNNLQSCQNEIQNNRVQNQVQNQYFSQNYYQVQNNYQDRKYEQLDSIKQFGPPPGLSKPLKPQNSLKISAKNSKFASTSSFSSSSYSDSSDSEVLKISTQIPSDEELLKDRSAIFATDFSSDSNFSDNDFTSSDNNDPEQISGFKLNPTAQVFQPKFS